MKRVKIELPAKELRSRCIAGAVEIPVVCLTCGNSAKALRRHGLEVVEISPYGKLSANKWCSTTDIRQMFPSMYDATSGHLPVDMMVKIGKEMTIWLEENGVRFDPQTEYVIPSGSGETVVCLKLANPDISFVAQYDKSNTATMYDEENPMNALVRMLAKVEILGEA